MLVSAIIPVFNQAPYLRQSIESVLNQDLTNILPNDSVDLELIIVDDKSTDDSLAIAHEYWQREENVRLEALKEATRWGRSQGWSEEKIENSVARNKIKIIEQPQNMGLALARNTGINSASSKLGYDLILPLDADDWIDPNYLKKTVPLMKEGVAVVGTHAAVFGIKDYVWYTHSPTIEDIMRDNCVPVCSLIQRRAFDETKGYKSELRCGYEDWNLWIDIVERGYKIEILPEPLFHYREKPNSMLKDATKKREGLVSQIHRLHPGLWLSNGEINPSFASARKRLHDSAIRHKELVELIHKSHPNLCSPQGKVEDAKNYVGNDAVSGFLQCDLLKQVGCLPTSMVLDIGCGALYAGFFIAQYLETGRFVGMEPNKWLIDAALEQKEIQEIMTSKQAQFLYREDFDASSLGIKFDYILSHSILSHAAHWQLGQFLKNTCAVLAPNGKIIASLRLAEGNSLGNSGTVDRKDSGDKEWLYPGNSFFELNTIINTAANCGLKAEYKPEYTKFFTDVNYSEFHDWFVFTKLENK